MPDETGECSYITTSNQTDLNGKSGVFVCTPAAPGVHGPVRVRNQYHFGYADGKPFFPFGTTIYEWSFRGAERRAQTIVTLKASPFNKVRMLAMPPYNNYYMQGPGKLKPYMALRITIENRDAVKKVKKGNELNEDMN